jgi:hypothetical protein
MMITCVSSERVVPSSYTSTAPPHALAARQTLLLPPRHPPTPSSPSKLTAHRRPLVFDTGNPWVLSIRPVPVPVHTCTCEGGYGFVWVWVQVQFNTHTPWVRVRVSFTQSHSNSFIFKRQCIYNYKLSNGMLEVLLLQLPSPPLCHCCHIFHHHS